MTHEKRLLVGETSRVGYRCAATLHRLREVSAALQNSPAETAKRLAEMEKYIKDTETELTKIKTQAPSSQVDHQTVFLKTLEKLNTNVNIGDMDPDILGGLLMTLRWSLDHVITNGRDAVVNTSNPKHLKTAKFLLGKLTEVGTYASHKPFVDKLVARAKEEGIHFPDNTLDLVVPPP